MHHWAFSWLDGCMDGQTHTVSFPSVVRSMGIHCFSLISSGEYSLSVPIALTLFSLQQHTTVPLTAYQWRPLPAFGMKNCSGTHNIFRKTLKLQKNKTV